MNMAPRMRPSGPRTNGALDGSDERDDLKWLFDTGVEEATVIGPQRRERSRQQHEPGASLAELLPREQRKLRARQLAHALLGDHDITTSRSQYIERGPRRAEPKRTKPHITEHAVDASDRPWILIHHGH